MYLTYIKEAIYTPITTVELFLILRLKPGDGARRVKLEVGKMGL